MLRSARVYHAAGVAAFSPRRCLRLRRHVIDDEELLPYALYARVVTCCCRERYAIAACHMLAHERCAALRHAFSLLHYYAYAIRYAVPRQRRMMLPRHYVFHDI